MRSPYTFFSNFKATLNATGISVVDRSIDNDTRSYFYIHVYKVVG